MKRILREPLFQFLVIGAIVFAGYAAIQDRTATSEPDTIVVTPGRINQLAETFARTWQRPPTREELDGLVDAFVKEEVFYREGRKLGLDTDDTVFRRRLQQKMEFLMEPGTEELTPGDGELQAYLKANPDTYRIPARVAFRQIFFDPQRRGEGVSADANAALDRLRGGLSEAETAELGDATLLPAGMPLVSVDQVAISFGSEFADALADAPAGDWAGPIASTFGVHLVRVDDRSEAREPELAEVAGAVARDWEARRRREISDKRYADLRAQYEVVVEMPSGGQAGKGEADE